MKKVKITRHNKNVIDTKLEFKNIQDLIAVRNYIEQIIIKTLK